MELIDKIIEDFRDECGAYVNETELRRVLLKHLPKEEQKEDMGEKDERGFYINRPLVEQPKKIENMLHIPVGETKTDALRKKLQEVINFINNQPNG